MTEFEKVMMERDGMNRTDARRERQAAREAFYDMIEDGADYDDIEYMLAGDYGLEMDYIMDLI